MRKITCILLVVGAIWAPRASAFDGARKGFLLGLGLGFGTAKHSYASIYNFHPDLNYKESKTEKALMNEWKIGYAPGNQWEIYFTNEDAYFGYEYNTIGIEALCITKMSKPSSPSIFYTIGVGVPYWGDIHSWRLGTDNFGILGGIGYEFHRHLDLVAEILYGHRDYYYAGDVIWQARNYSIRITINALAY